MDNPEKDESPPGAPAPSGKSTSFPLDLVDKVARRDASQKGRDKDSGLLLSVHAPIRTPLTGKKEPHIVENPWKAASPASTGSTEESAEQPRETGEAAPEEPAELAHAESLNEQTAPAESEDGRETVKTGEPTSIMEVFMAAKKRGRPPKKSSASMAMGEALDRQEKKTSAIEKMLDKNIATEISMAKVSAARTKPKPKPKPKTKRALADIVSEVASRKDEKKAAPRAAKVAAKPAAKVAAKPAAKAAAKSRVVPKKAAPAPKAKAAPPTPRPRVTPRRAATGSVDVVVESLATGLISLLGGAVSGVMAAGKVAGQAVSTGAQYVAGGTKSAAAKVKATVRPARGAKAKKDEGPVAAAAKTAAQVTDKVADGLSSVASGAVKISGQVVSGVATVAGYTVKGGIAIVSDTANALINTASGLLNMVIGPKRKRRKTA